MSLPAPIILYFIEMARQRNQVVSEQPRIIVPSGLHERILKGTRGPITAPVLHQDFVRKTGNKPGTSKISDLGRSYLKYLGAIGSR